MATGDDAIAAGMDIVVGSTTPADTIDTEINKTRDYIAQRTEDVVPIVKGGTGATTQLQAQKNLGLEKATTLSDTNGKIAAYSATGQIGVNDPTSTTHAVNKRTLDAAIAGIPGGGGGLADGPTSTAYNRGTTGSGYFAVWMNAQLQFMRNTSARRFKKRIRRWRPAAGSIMKIRTVTFDRIGGDPNEVGFIAEEVLDSGLGEAVVYFDGKIDGINDRVILAALLAHVQDLTRRLEKLE